MRTIVEIDFEALSRVIDERLGASAEDRRIHGGTFTGEQAGLRDLAKVSGISARTLNRLASGRSSRASFWTLDALAVACGVHVSSLEKEGKR